MKRIRITALLLCFCLLLSFLPVSVLADDAIPFTDVSSRKWYYESICYVYSQGLMKGTEHTTFSPNDTLTRGMLVTILYRMAGSPEAGSADFTDVRQNAYYAPAVAWAQAHGIVRGYSDGSFRPNADITRQELVTILYRYVADLGGQPLQRSNLNRFSDQSSVNSFAIGAVRWAVAVGILKGRTSSTLEPQGTATRAECAALIMRLSETVLEDDSILYPTVANVPILSMHSIVESDPNDYAITAGQLDAVLSALSEAGYHTVSYRQLVDFVDNGTPLPDRPIVITLDDGYEDNISVAYPVFRKYGFCAEISVICAYIGQSSFCGEEITPHFALEEIAALEDGTFYIESHTCNLHMRRSFIPVVGGRYNVARLVGESDADYYAALLEDFTLSRSIIAEVLDEPLALTYPHNYYTLTAEEAAKDAGFRITVAGSGSNIITCGNADSLYLLNRTSVKSDTSPEALLQTLEQRMAEAER